MRVSGIFIQENPAEKVKNDDLLGQKPLKLVWKQSIFLDLSGLSNYLFVNAIAAQILRNIIKFSRFC